MMNCGHRVTHCVMNRHGLAAGQLHTVPETYPCEHSSITCADNKHTAHITEHIAEFSYFTRPPFHAGCESSDAGQSVVGDVLVKGREHEASTGAMPRRPTLAGSSVPLSGLTDGRYHGEYRMPLSAHINVAFQVLSQVSNEFQSLSSFQKLFQGGISAEMAPESIGSESGLCGNDAGSTSFRETSQ